jgi:hypothetical protein
VSGRAHRGLARKSFNATGTTHQELTCYSTYVIKFQLKAKIESRKERL